MKRVLYMNLLYNNSGQRRMDVNIIRELSSFCDVYVVCPDGWYPQTFDNVTYIYFDPSDNGIGGKFSHFVKEIKLMSFAKKLDTKYRFDRLIFASYETAVFCMGLSWGKKRLSKSFIIHNNNIDRMNAVKLKRILFNHYKNKVNHIVLEDFIGKYLHECIGVKENRVFLLPHPLNQNTNSNSVEKFFDCVGISNSNSDDWVTKVIEKERLTQKFKKHNCHVILRSKISEFDDGFLKVVNGWMSDEEYNYYINSAATIFLPFPSTFQYRMSGSVVDAFSNYTAVIGSKIPIFKYYEKRFPTICKTVDSVDDFFEAVCGTKKNNLNDDFMQFISEHSDEVVNNSLKIIVS